MSLETRLRELETCALAELDGTPSPARLEEWRVRYLGRKGDLAALISEVRSVAADERPAAGRTANAVKAALEAAYEGCSEALRGTADVATFDVTLPGIPPAVGGLHLTRQTLYEIERIFRGMGFDVYESPEVETDALNFGLLNIPPDHPARDMWDTFYVGDDLLLRTHTSPGQIRAMRSRHPEPIRVILPGKCHRYEAVSARSDSMFYQVEGLAIAEGITLADLKGVFTAFAQQFYGPEREMRFRASYFPFTEPSVEIDISCTCGGAGCTLCKGTGWLEISGGGMVHPVVLRNGGYDPDRVTGFAFGMGVERPALLRHEIDDIRRFYANDLRFLEQFA